MTTISNVVQWVFALLVIAVGVANLILVDPVPALAYALASLVYLPPATGALSNRFGTSIHPVAQVVFGIVMVVFTLGVSDLGEMID
ncbi:MAG: hypothetical protein ACJ8GK_11130 [Luteimonas sp.]